MRPRLLRDSLAYCLRTIPLKGRWRIAKHLNRFFAAEAATFNLSGVGRLTVDLGIEMQQHVYWAGISRDDARMLNLARQLLPSDGVFLDIGANIGIHTLAIGRHVSAGGTVVAFEPHPTNHRLLLHNIQQNQMRHVMAENLGLADSPSVLTGTASENGGNWSLASRGDYRFEVRLVRLDDYLNENPLSRIDLLKIDVEGAEVQVLRGARQTIERFHPVIVFEVCPRWLAKMQSSPVELFAELTRHGYTIHSLPDHDLRCTRRVKVGDLAGMAALDFINLLALPPGKASRDIHPSRQTEAHCESAPRGTASVQPE